MTEDRDYFSELKINKYALDQEWENQAERAMYWARQSAIAFREYQEIEMDRKIIKAKLYKKYRLQLENEVAKVTDVMIDAHVRTDPEYRKATEKLIAAKEISTIMEDVRWNFVTRKTALENIQQGIVAGLFSHPQSKGEDDLIRDRIEQRRRNR